MSIKSMWQILKIAGKGWSEDNVSRLAAAIAYYTIFSLSPLLLICIAIAGSVFGEEAARGQLVGQMRSLVGDQGARVIEDAVQSASAPDVRSIASIISIAVLLFGASGVFAQLQDALNTIWNVEARPGASIFSLIRQRLLSFSAVLGVGFLLIVSLVVSAALTAAGSYFANVIPGHEAVWGALNALVSFTIITLLFALLFKFMPDVEVRWRDVWFGAILTSVLFVVGKTLLGVYLGRGSFGSAYGAAGSLVVLLAWIYYSAQIFLFGAELTQAYAEVHREPVKPAPHAVRVRKQVVEDKP